MRILLCVVLLIAAARPTAAQRAITEDDVVRAIRAEDPVLEAARLRADAAASRPDQIVWPFPMVDVGFMPSMIADGEAGLEIMARQRVPWPGLLERRRTERRHEAEASRLESGAIERERVLDGRIAYARLWQAHREAELIERFVARIDIFEESALSTYAAGRGPQQAVIQVQLERERLLQRRERLDDERIALRADLVRLTGGRIPVQGDLTLAPPPSADATSVDDAAVRLAVTSHPDVAAMEAMRQASTASADVARLEGRPELTVGANINLSPMARERMYGLEPVMPVVGVSLPLWRSGVRAEVQEQTVRAAAYASDAEAARVRLSSEADALLAQLNRAEARIARLRDRLRPRVDVALESTLTALRAGTARTIELLDLERSALEIDVEILTEEVRRAELYALLRSLLGE